MQDQRIIIVGAGVFGLSTALHLTDRGYKDVTIFDHQPYHENAYDPAKGCDGASADVNKIFRCSYGHETEYQDLAFSGRDIWQRWNREIASSAAENLPQGLSPSTELFVNNGFLRVSAGSSLSAYDQECLEQLDKAGLRDYQHVVSNEHDRARLSQLDVDQPGQNWIHKLDLYSEKTSPEDGKPLEAFLDTSAGFTRADKACAWVRHLCDKAGVKFILGKEGRLAKLIQEERNGERVVSGIATTDGKTHSADLVVVAAGSWTPSIVPGLSHVLEATAGSVITIKLPEDRKDLWDKYSPDKFPVIAYGLTGHNSPVYGGLYGFPRTEHGLIKIGYRGRKWTNFEESKFTGERTSIPRTAYSEDPVDNLPEQAIECLRLFVETFWADLKDIGITQTRMCWYTDSNDNNFVIDYVPGYNKTLFVCSGGSGHGFKFLPVLGKHVVNQIEGVQDQFTPLWRFRKPEGGQTNLNGLEEGEDGERLLRKLKLADQSYWTWAVDKAQEVMTDLTNGMNRVL